MSLLAHAIDCVIGIVVVGGALTMKLWLGQRLHRRGHCGPR